MPLYGQSGYGSGRYGIADAGPVYSLPISYYLALFTSQYRQAANLLAFATAALTPLDDYSNLLNTIGSDFDLDYAVGAQLDTRGQIIGQPRQVGFTPSGSVSPILDDDTYRLLLKARIGFNQWDGTIDGLQALWRQLFPGGTINVIDGQNMSALIILTGSFTSIIQDLISHGYIIPRSETVQYTFSFGTLPLFGFDRGDGFIAGFDVGHWS